MHSIKQYIHCRRLFPIIPVTSLDSDRRSSVVLNVQCPCECPRDDFPTLIQLIQEVLKLETRHTNALYQTVYSLPPSLSYFSCDVTGQRPTVLLNVQCPRECPRDDFPTFIQLIQEVLRLETRDTNALYQTVYSLPPPLSYFSRDVTGQRPTVVLNVQCPRECPRDDFPTLIQLIQEFLKLQTRHTNAVYQTVYSLPPSLSYFSRDVTGQRPTVVLNVQCPR